MGKLDDPKNICRDVSKVGHWGAGDYELNVKDWLEMALEQVQDNGVIYLNWENYGTTVPLIV